MLSLKFLECSGIPEQGFGNSWFRKNKKFSYQSGISDTRQEVDQEVCQEVGQQVDKEAGQEVDRRESSRWTEDEDNNE